MHQPYIDPAPSLNRANYMLTRQELPQVLLSFFPFSHDLRQAVLIVMVPSANHHSVSARFATRVRGFPDHPSHVRMDDHHTFDQA